MPTATATVQQWAGTWAAMCADGDVAHGSLNDDRYAKATFGVSSRQLRLICSAVTSGALARRAVELGVHLLPDLAARVSLRINGQQLNKITAA